MHAWDASPAHVVQIHFGVVPQATLVGAPAVVMLHPACDVSQTSAVRSHAY